MSIVRSRMHRRPRSQNPMQNMPEKDTPVVITDATVDTSTLTLTFNQSVALDGVPQFEVDVVGASPVSAVQTAPNIVAVTYNNSIALATAITIPHRDPAIRSKRGGYVIANNVTI